MIEEIEKPLIECTRCHDYIRESKNVWPDLDGKIVCSKCLSTIYMGKAFTFWHDIKKDS